MPATCNYSLVDMIKARLPILEAIQSLIPVEWLTVRGNRATGLCPLHNEKTPSFTVYLDQNSWHCFGCHQGGDVIALYAKYRGISNSEAIKELAAYLGLTRTLSPAEKTQVSGGRRKLQGERRLEALLQERVKEAFCLLADAERCMERYMLVLREAGKDPLEDGLACWWLERRGLCEYWLDELSSGDKLRQIKAFGEVLIHARTLS